MSQPIASVLIPVRNEEEDIEACLHAVAGQDVGPEHLEVILADGMSTDHTRDIIARVGPTLGFGSIRCIPNPACGISAGLNLALAEASADVVVRVDARSRVEPHHVRTVLGVLGRDVGVGVVGGAQVPMARGSSLQSRGIARALSNSVTTGLSRYRRNTTSGPSDTVWLGAFRTEQVRRLGGWDEGLVVNEDFDLCERYRTAGFVVWFEATLRSGYLPRRDLGALARQYHRFGRAKGAGWSAGRTLTPRHVALVSLPPAAALAAIVTGGRFGYRRVLPVAAGLLLLVDELGSAAPARIGERVFALLATLVSNGAWWIGVVAGYCAPGGRT